MRLEIDSVAHFHEKMGVSETQPMGKELLGEIMDAGDQLVRISQRLEARVADQDKRWLRAHLLVEELGEMLLAAGKGDEIGAFDGLLDLLYVLLGTGVTFDWPIEEGFAEVHVSNMTKVKQPDDPSKERVRVKGDGYRPPDLSRVMREYRDGRFPKIRTDFRKHVLAAVARGIAGVENLSTSDKRLVQRLVDGLQVNGEAIREKLRETL